MAEEIIPFRAVCSAHGPDDGAREGPGQGSSSIPEPECPAGGTAGEAGDTSVQYLLTTVPSPGSNHAVRRPTGACE
jgi:hypothetical protein